KIVLQRIVLLLILFTILVMVHRFV
ncbi:polysaccharide biosynthesis family protein, partial [Vibrio parahaemolyticus V-223/04]